MLRGFFLIFITVFLSAINAETYGQHKIDSLIAEFKSSDNETAKIKLLITAGDIYKNTKPDLAIFFYKTFLNSIASPKNKLELKLSANCFENIANIYYNKYDYRNALKYYTLSLGSYVATNDSLGIAKAYHNIGGAYTNLESFDKALESIFKALKIFELINNKTGLAKAYNNIGLIHSILNNNDKALYYYLKSNKINLELNDSASLSLNYRNIGNIYSHLHLSAKAIDCFNKSLFLSKELGNKINIADCYNDMGIAYSYYHYEDAPPANKQHDNLNKAFQCFSKALKINKEENNKAGMITAYINLADLSNRLGIYNDAIDFSKKALMSLSGIKSIRRELAIYGNLAISLDSARNYKEAVKYYKLYQITNDSIFNIEKNKQIETLQIKYETEKKEKEIEALQNEKIIKELEIDRQKKLKTIFILGGLVLLLISFFLYSMFYRKRKTNKILTDINKKLTESEANLIRLNNTKNRFFSIISHDLRSPLSSLRTSLNFFLENQGTFSKDELTRFTSSILKSVDSITELFENLLSWSLTETKQINFQPYEFDLYEIVNETARLVEPKLLQKKIQFNSSVEQNTIIYADKNMIRFIIRNLISNAIKFTHEHGEINIDASPENDMLFIRIKDTGIGISPENLNKLFDVNKRFSTAGTDNEKGTGLGLMLCKEFVEKNRGEIFVTSELKKGSEFTFSIPLAD